MSGRAYLSIGDVLTLLRQEFPDVTISKIRFLESQGLVNPERTPSGYRKFYDPDVERLRWVLRQQREHFLPLKVIKGRLEGVDPDEGNGRHHEQAKPAAPATPRNAGPTPAPTPSDAPAPTPSPARGGGAAGAAATPAAARAGRSPLPGFEGGEERAAEAAEAAEAVEAPAAEATPAPKQGRAPRPAAPPAALAEGDMTVQELAAASDCPAPVLAGLESFGLITGRQIGGTVYFGEDALAVARLAASFSTYGVEPRHLRLHKHAAEREAGFIEQVVLPLLRQRNPEARRRAHESVEDLSRLGQELRAVLLQRALRDQLGG